MTPGDGSEVAHVQFAAELLGIDGAENPASVLRRLHDDDFLPDPVTHDAIRVLYGRPVGAGSWLAEEAARTDEQRLFDEVERFAAEFFAIPCAERRERWRSLALSCAPYARLSDRLQTLRYGLDISSDMFRGHPPLVERLAGLIFALFVLPPGPQAVERRRRVRELRADQTIRRTELSRALKRLWTQHKNVVALAPEFLTQLAQPRRPKGIKRWRANLAVVSNSSWSDRPAGAIGVLVIIFTLIRMCALFVGSQNGPQTLTVYPPPSSGVVSPALPRINKEVTAMLVRDFREELKIPIRSGLAKLGQLIDDSQLQRVVDALPPDGIPPFRGLATLSLHGFRRAKVEGLYAAAIRKELAASGIVIDEKEAGEIARECLVGTVKTSGGNPGFLNGGSQAPAIELP